MDNPRLIKPLLWHGLEQSAHSAAHVLGGEAEVRQQFAALARGPEAIYADHPTLVADVAPPRERGAGLHRLPAADRAGQHALPVSLVLSLVHLRRGHGHQPDSPAT